MSDRELDRRDGGKDEFMSDEDAREATEKYVLTCVTIIPLIAKSRADLERWWREEDVHRIKYGLTRSQEARIIQACRDQIERLDDARPSSCTNSNGGGNEQRSEERQLGSREADRRRTPPVRRI